MYEVIGGGKVQAVCKTALSAKNAIAVLNQAGILAVKSDVGDKVSNMDVDVLKIGSATYHLEEAFPLKKLTHGDFYRLNQGDEIYAKTTEGELLQAIVVETPRKLCSEEDWHVKTTVGILDDHTVYVRV